MQHKAYVEVLAKFDVEGNIFPLSVTLEDETTYGIDKIIDIKNCHSLKIDAEGMRYTCIISGKRYYLTYDNKIWFIEPLN